MAPSKVVVITGGASGIGKAAALLFAKNEYKRENLNTDNGQATVKEIEKNGGEALFVKTNVTSEESVKNLIEEIVSKYERLDVAVNSAGVVSKLEPLHAISKNSFEKILNINVIGVFLSMKYQIEQFLKQGTGGSIINLSSLAGQIAAPSFSPYCTSKHAVIGLTKCAAQDYLKDKIRVNALCPSFIDTPMVGQLLHDIKDSLKLGEVPPASSLSGHVGTADEIANAIYWLASPAASYVNGTTLTMDGGAAPNTASMN